MNAYRITLPAAYGLDDVGQMRDSLQLQLDKLVRLGYPCTYEMYEENERTIFRCQLHTHNKGELRFRYGLGLALADYILSYKAHAIIRSLIQKQFQYAHPEETDEIEAHVHLLLRERERKQKEKGVRLTYEDRVARGVAHFLAAHQQVAVDGFLHFRMKSYRRSLERVVEKAIEDYMLDQEYKEFIQLLRYFVQIQESKMPLVHVLHVGQRRFRLLDREGSPVQVEVEGSPSSDLMEQVHSHEDLVVSTLLTMAPAHVILHSRHLEENVIRTLVQIFEGRIVVCEGCSDCTASLYLKGDA
ncbi:putative sporulation protein YtxC [Mechercharimyces sp. CAU 1602]|uniref:putative sporulation protein YtxC n=1 Tax=Mechercharimyces sp. CAU 1602 TaxID=2973933 RepID=UPI00216280FB|nr:putative sporulation protein YtxC [Mechercharimyces sp. CAU 1602]MCS1351572.1 putative sporulation protein YtxC [Mechercharimyces sp. CAU 1602]